MPRSLLDSVDLAATRRAGARRAGPAGMVLACLLDGGVFQHDPHDPGWADRDRLVAASGPMARAASAALGPATVVAAAGGRALAVAVGMAFSAQRAGGVSRVYCLLGPGACDDGALWEAAVAAVTAGAESLTAIVVAGHWPAARAGDLFSAAQWRTAVADASDPVALLGALDRTGLPGWPGAVLAVLP